MNYNSQIDDYILKAQPFAQPILHHLRKLIHDACPQVEEKIKWGMPCFDYHGIMCNFASFKQHCTFGFWKAALMKDQSLMENAAKENSMGHLGRITDIKLLPSDRKINAYIKEAMLLNEKGIKVQRIKNNKAIDQESEPEYMLKALRSDKKVLANYESFSPSCKREYIEWVTEAKTELTRTKRLQQAILWIKEGKKRNWKYEKK